ncbi:MAG: class 1 fructose-bisphosphatase [Calditrichaeota bacterium]|nr:class 1 fructose-bisphosphatase [Calditrichota bacterium]RQV99091.1 MAG: class 1 fructose-bisphosphatase [Calditrichota bacterium]
MANFVQTLNRHIIEQERLHPKATGAFTALLTDIALAGKIISYHVNKAGLVDILGKSGGVNIYGEKQEKLDVFANRAMVRALVHGGQLCAMASEEADGIIPIPSDYPIGRYICCFDPLDGSSNIEANVSIGTIFSIFKRVTPDGKPGTDADILQPGRNQVAAGYVIYGSSTMMVYTTGSGVYGFTLDPSYGEFILSHENLKIPKKGKTYSINESYIDYWDEGVVNYVRWAKKAVPEDGRPLNSRYIGSLVADFHRNLLYGGIFLYPGDNKSPSRKQGKLRLMYEANPLAFVVEQAGGRASDGYRPIMDIKPTDVHQQVPLIIGSEEDVNIAEDFIQGKRKE